MGPHANPGTASPVCRQHPPLGGVRLLCSVPPPAAPHPWALHSIPHAAIKCLLLLSATCLHCHIFSFHSFLPGEVGFKFMSGQGQSPALWGMSTGTAHMPDHFSFPLAFTVTRLREWKPHLDYSLWYLLWYHNTGKNRRFLPQHRRQQHVPAGLPPGLSFASSITK